MDASSLSKIGTLAYETEGLYSVVGITELVINMTIILQ